MAICGLGKCQKNKNSKEEGVLIYSMIIKAARRTLVLAKNRAYMISCIKTCIKDIIINNGHSPHENERKSKWMRKEKEVLVRLIH